VESDGDCGAEYTGIGGSPTIVLKSIHEFDGEQERRGASVFNQMFGPWQTRSYDASVQKLLLI